MKHLSALSLFLSLLISSPAMACGNEYEAQTRPDGSPVHLYQGEGGTFINARLTYGFDTTGLQKQKATLLLKIEQGSSYQALSDLALIELKIGDKYKGVQLLEKLYQQYPNEYNIVANLGTGYELIGNNELAYRFIKRALEINPESHRGSEWIHLNILEQKLNPSPDYSAILQLETSKSIRTFYKSFSPSQIQELYPVKEQLIYQLGERIAFIAPEDAIIGQLLFDLADLVAITESVEQAAPIYHFALEYDPGLSLVNSRLREIKEAQYINPLLLYWPWLLGAICFAAVLYYLMNRKRNRKAVISEENTTA